MRTNPDGSIYTFTAYKKATGDAVLVDDRTFHEDAHTLEPAKAEKPTKADKPAKGSEK